jgi:ribosomal protein S18 acetylase RimI-like enzyme
MEYSIRQMTIDDYEEVYCLWKQAEGLSLEESDTREGIALYLGRNPGLCFVATVSGEIVAAVLCGHEGRRGILRHLAVKREFRLKGIARSLVEECLVGLAKEGIKKCNTFVLDQDPEARRFWERMGWSLLEDNYRTLQSPTKQGKH